MENARKNKIVSILYYFEFSLFVAIFIFSFFATSKLISIGGHYFSLSFFISLIALPLFYFSYFFVFKVNYLHKIIRILLIMFTFLFITSMGMSIFLFPDYSGLFGTTTTMVFIESSAKYIYDLALIPFFIFFISTANKKIIKIIFYSFFISWALFGLFQIVVYAINNDILWRFYDSLDLLKIIGGNSALYKRIMLNYHSFRFCGFGSEPSSNASLICCVFFPYLTYQIINNKKLSKRITNIVFLSIAIVFAVLTKSSMVIFGMLIELIFIYVYFVTSKKYPKKYKIISVAILVIGISLVFIIPPIREGIIMKNLARIFDLTHYSTLYRYSTIWNDIKIFIRFPIFGIGDGNQGYFYMDNVIQTIFSVSPESESAMKGEFGLLAGGPGVPSILSAFGLFGIFVIYFAYKNYTKNLMINNIYNASLYRFYLATMVCHFFFLLASENLHRYYCFFFSLASICAFTKELTSGSKVTDLCVKNIPVQSTTNNKYYEVSI